LYPAYGCQQNRIQLLIYDGYRNNQYEAHEYIRKKKLKLEKWAFLKSYG
jgi:hypothetical protein